LSRASRRSPCSAWTRAPGALGLHPAQRAGALGAAECDRDELPAKQVDGLIALCGKRVSGAPANQRAPISEASAQHSQGRAMMAPAKQGHRFSPDTGVAVPGKASEATPRQRRDMRSREAQELEPVPLLFSRRARERRDENPGAVHPLGSDDPLDHVRRHLGLSEQRREAWQHGARVGSVVQEPGQGQAAGTAGSGQLRRLFRRRHVAAGQHDLHCHHGRAVVATERPVDEAPDPGAVGFGRQPDQRPPGRRVGVGREHHEVVGDMRRTEPAAEGDPVKPQLGQRAAQELAHPIRCSRRKADDPIGEIGEGNDA
jgi:hypothetical protein